MTLSFICILTRIVATATIHFSPTLVLTTIIMQLEMCVLIGERHQSKTPLIFSLSHTVDEVDMNCSTYTLLNIAILQSDSVPCASVIIFKSAET